MNELQDLRTFFDLMVNLDLQSEAQALLEEENSEEGLHFMALVQSIRETRQQDPRTPADVAAYEAGQQSIQPEDSAQVFNARRRDGTIDRAVWIDDDHVNRLFVDAQAIDNLTAENTRLQAELDAVNSKLDAARAALRPFADFYNANKSDRKYSTVTDFLIEDFRTAYATLSGGEERGNGE